jgi:D-arabinonate dehydratase/D-galactarolactone cycloisomerase
MKSLLEDPKYSAHLAPEHNSLNDPKRQRTPEMQFDKPAADPIVGVDLYTLSAEVPPFSDARHAITSREAMWVKVKTASGLEGWGEAAVWGGPAGVTANILLQELFPIIKGEDSTSIHYVWEKMYQHTAQHGRRGAIVAAMGALDIALWDIMARRANQPLVNILGRQSDTVTPYASAGFYSETKDLDGLRAEYARLKDKGFRAFKMKVGRQKREWSKVWDRPNVYTLEQDIERVYAVRETIGDDAILLVDANTEWDTVTTTTFLTEIGAARPFFMEEPVSADLFNHAVEVRQRTNVRIAGFETEYTRYAYRELLEAGAVDVVQPDPSWCGGLSEARRIAAMASAYGKLAVPHSFSSVLSLMTSIHFVASLDNGFLVEWDSSGNPWVDQFLLAENVLNEDGNLLVPAGAGIAFNPDIASLDGDVQHQEG